jgi:hypothetical protein
MMLGSHVVSASNDGKLIVNPLVLAGSEQAPTASPLMMVFCSRA